MDVTLPRNREALKSRLLSVFGQFDVVHKRFLLLCKCRSKLAKIGKKRGNNLTLFGVGMLGCTTIGTLNDHMIRRIQC